jgi:uncharacterized protein DUF4265
MVDEREALTKVHIDLPNHWHLKGEAIWAQDLGDDLYEIRNVPFCAYGLNYLDVVRATADGPDLKPEIQEVVRRSGHRTLRIMFKEGLSEDAQARSLADLASLDTSYERFDDRYVCLDVHPTADYGVVRDHLDEMERASVLDYETCEERVAGSFDDKPESGL